MTSGTLSAVIQLYRAGRATDYVVEKETMRALGDRSIVRLVDAMATPAFRIFLVPEKTEGGLQITYFVDKKELYAGTYTTEDYENIINKLADNKSTILLKYYKFLEGNDIVSLNDEIGFLLQLYSSYKKLLMTPSDANTTRFSDDSQLLKDIDLFNAGAPVTEDYERITGNGEICKDILDYIKKNIIKDTGDNAIYKLKIKFENEDAPEQPMNNFYYNHEKSIATSDFGTRKHADIPYDYIPRQ